MSRIRAKNTKPEMLVRKFLFSRGFRFRINDKRYPGKPDIILPKYNTVIFIHGCFWHGHPGCRFATVPKTRTEWWTDKIRGNAENDQRSAGLLTAHGWRVFTIWECELKKSLFEDTMARLETNIKKISP